VNVTFISAYNASELSYWG